MQKRRNKLQTSERALLFFAFYHIAVRGSSSVSRRQGAHQETALSGAWRCEGSAQQSRGVVLAMHAVIYNIVVLVLAN